MDYTDSHARARIPLPKLSSGHTYFTVESLRDIAALPSFPFSSSSSSSPAFASLQSLPIHRGGMAIPSTHDVSFPASAIRTHDLRETTVRGSNRDPYRQPITDREPTMTVDPRDLAHQYQQRELVHRLSPQPRFYQHRSRPQEFSKNSDRGLQPKFSKRAQREILCTKDISKPPRIPVRPGWCSLCDVDCNTKDVLHKKHVFGKKHQSMFEKLKEKVLGDGKKPQMEQAEELMGWCSLCEVDCGNIENLHKQHMLGKKHQLMLGIEKGPQIEKETAEMDNRIDNILGKRKQQVKEERNILSKKRQKLSDRRHAAQFTEGGNPDARLEVDGESKKCVDVDGHEENISKLLVSAKDDEEEGYKVQETVLEAKDNKDVEFSLLGAKSEKTERKESVEAIEFDGKKESAEPIELDGKKQPVLGDKIEDAAVVM